MTEIHSIRLHGPWQATVLSWLTPKSDLDPNCRMRIPSDWGDWLGVSFCGQVAFSRVFGLPTNLEADQKIWLVVEAVDFCGTVALNDQPVGAVQLGGSALRVEIRHLLGKSNNLRIAIEMPENANRGDRAGRAGGLIGGVRLEIEEPN